MKREKCIRVVAIIGFLSGLQPAIAQAEQPSNDVAWVNNFGEAQYRIPLDIPVSVKKVFPLQSLVYSSGKNNGYLGMGWQLEGGVSSIERCPKVFAIDSEVKPIAYNSNDEYCLDGSRLILQAGQPGQDGAEYGLTKNRYVKVFVRGIDRGAPNYFEVQHPGGRVQFFGKSTDSKVLTVGQRKAWRWGHSGGTTPDGGVVKVSYLNGADTGTQTPIAWFFTSADGDKYTIHARVATRPDEGLTPVDTTEFKRHQYRYRDLVYRENNQRKFEYKFTYQQTRRTELSRLATIQFCRLSNDCDSRIELSWGRSTGLAEQLVDIPVAVPYAAGNYSRNSCDYEKKDYKHLHDINGDGWLDYVHIAPVVGTEGQKAVYKKAGVNSLPIKLGLSDGAGSWAEETWSTHITANPNRFYFGDFNGDGKTDLAEKFSKSGSWDSLDIRLSISNGNDFDEVVWTSVDRVSETTHNGDVEQLQSHSSKFDFMDANGDGLPDMIEKAYFSYSSIRHTDVYIHINNGSGFDAPIKWLNEVKTVRELMDINGDGFLDAVIRGADNLYVQAISNAQHQVVSTIAIRNANNFPVMDLNGDGLRDSYFGNGEDHAGLLNSGKAFLSDYYSLQSGFIEKDFDNDGLNDGFSSTYDNRYGTSKINLLGNAGRENNFSLSGIMSLPQAYRSSEAYLTNIEFVDINGDGRTDVAANVSTTCYKPYNSWYRAKTRENGKMRMGLSKIDHPSQLRLIKQDQIDLVSFEYQPITKPDFHAKGNDSEFPIRDEISGKLLVSKLSVRNDTGSQDEIEFRYVGLRKNSIGRGLVKNGDLGFREIIQKNLAKDKEISTNYSLSYALLGNVESVETRRLSDDALIERQELEYDVDGNAINEASFAYLSEHRVDTYNTIDGELFDTQVKKSKIDSNGIVSELRAPVLIPNIEYACQRPD